MIEALMRPFAMDVLLTCEKKDAGTVSSLINFIPTFFVGESWDVGRFKYSEDIMSDKAVAHRCKNDLLDFTCFLYY